MHALLEDRSITENRIFLLRTRKKKGRGGGRAALFAKRHGIRQEEAVKTEIKL